jgi:hypothetical protein
VTTALTLGLFRLFNAHARPFNQSCFFWLLFLADAEKRKRIENQDEMSTVCLSNPKFYYFFIVVKEIE